MSCTAVTRVEVRRMEWGLVSLVPGVRGDSAWRGERCESPSLSPFRGWGGRRMEWGLVSLVPPGCEGTAHGGASAASPHHSPRFAGGGEADGMGPRVTRPPECEGTAHGGASAASPHLSPRFAGGGVADGLGTRVTRPRGARGQRMEGRALRVPNLSPPFRGWRGGGWIGDSCHSSLRGAPGGPSQIESSRVRAAAISALIWAWRAVGSGKRRSSRSRSMKVTSSSSP